MAIHEDGTPYRIDEFFIVMVPSRNGKMFMDTAFTLPSIAGELDKIFLPIPVNGFQVEKVRTMILEEARATLTKEGITHGNVVRALLMDDDLLFGIPFKDVSNAIRTADANGWNLVSNYKNIGDKGKLVNMLGQIDALGTSRFLSPETISELKDGQELPDGMVSGLGFYYGDIPLDYKFHWDALSEDLNFFLDTKPKLHYWDLGLRHEKHLLI